MIRLHRPQRQRATNAFTWAKTGDATTQNIRDSFGPRTFSAHLFSAGLGFDYDFHRGADLPLAAGDPVYAMSAGAVIRLHETFYGWDTATQLAKWTEVDAAGSAVFSQTGSSLRVVGSRVGAQAIGAAGRIGHGRERVDISSGDWEIRIKPLGGQTTTGGVVGFGFREPVTGEYVAIEYNGTAVTARGTQTAGVMSVDGTAVTVAPAYLRITYTQSADTIAWQYTTSDPLTTSTTWTSVATLAGVAFTREGWPAFTPIAYWRSTDTNAAAQTFDVDHIGWFDANGISRFGNCLFIQNSGRVSMVHLRELACSFGDLVEAGQLIGYAGNEGFDSRSGPVLFVHCHIEYTTLDNYYYSNSDPINPLGVGVLPRTNVSNNVAVVRATANDPDAVVCWLLTVTVTRANEDLDVNSITLTGNLATRALDWNTRAGLNADNDIPKQAGVYVVCVDFDETSSTLVYQVYFSKAVVGSTFVSASIADTAGAVLWSE